MSNQQLRVAAGAASERKTPASFPTMLEAYKGEIARALPKHLSADRMARIALTCFRQNPALADCEPKSVFAAVILGAQLGLEPGISGQAYLIPYKKQCQFVPGWQGLVDLVSRAGRASVWTGAVYAGDEFDYALGDRPFVKHKPVGDEDSMDALRYVYAVGRVKEAEWPVIEVWPMSKVRKHLTRYNKVGRSHYAHENMEMYGRKVALLQVLKYMPKSVEVLTGIALANSESTPQDLNISDAISGAFVPPAIKGESSREDGQGDGNQPTGLSFAEIADLINKSPDVDGLDLAASHLAGIEDKQQRVELSDLINARRIALS